MISNEDGKGPKCDILQPDICKGKFKEKIYHTGLFEIAPQLSANISRSFY